MYQPQPRYNLLAVPGLGRFLRWRHGRSTLQLLLLAITAVLLYDAFTGPQLAAENLATVVTWVHYRGFVMLALLLAGNLFCMSCPFALPRSIAHKLSRNGRRWPRFLRNKWVAIAILVIYFWLYEWFDLWSSPLLTGWVIIAYFLSAFLLEALFAESPFCKYVCPLGTFNFTSATISPLQITVQSRDVCRTCVGKECINGRNTILGCGTELFPPQIKSNMDCTFCLDCARACPYDNVALALRHPLTEATHAQPFPRRWDINLLILIFAFLSLSNAFGMTPPVYTLTARLMALSPIKHEGLILGLILGGISFLLPLMVGVSASYVSRHFAQRREPLRHTLARYAPAFLPLTFAIWLAHYAGFHFLGSGLTIIPVTQNFLLDHNIALGTPNWLLGAVVPLHWLDPLELLILLGGLAASLYALTERGRRAAPHPDPLLAQLPWLTLLLALTIASLYIFYLPMEMRGG